MAMNVKKILNLCCIIILSSFLFTFTNLSLSQSRGKTEVPSSKVKFVDVTKEADIKFKHAGGLQEQVIPALVGSGAAFADYNNDNLLDIYIANASIVFPTPSAKLPTNALYRNNGDGTFMDVTEQAGVGDTGWGRGCVFGDYDNDGDIDIFIVNNGETPRLLCNDGGNKNNWLKVKTVGVKSNKDGIGARVTVKSGSLIQIREVSGGSSYISQNSLEVEFGLGQRNRVDSIEIRWPSGIIQKLENVSVNQTITVVESGKK